MPLNPYATQTTRNAIAAMGRSHQRDSAYMANQGQMYDAVLAMMEAALGGLEIARRESHAAGGFTMHEANAWLDLFEQIAPIIAQIPFGYGPVKALPVLGTKVAAATGISMPLVDKIVNNAVDISGSTSVVMTPLGWVDKIAQAFSVTGYAHGAATYGSHFATPLGVKTALSPTLANLLNQIAHWTGSSTSAFAHFATNFAAVGSAFAHLMAALKVYLSYSKLDGVQSVLDHYSDHGCSCCEYTREIVDMCMDASMDAALALNPVTAVIPVWHMAQKKSHAIANKFRDDHDRTHRRPHAIAMGLLDGAQMPSRHEVDRTSPPRNASARCPVAMLTIATLFGNGNPAKGYKAAVAAIQAIPGTGADKLKGKIG